MTKGIIKVGMSTCGLAAGAQKIFDLLENEVKRRNHQIQVKKVGCIGACYAEPLVDVNVEGTPHVLYAKVDEKTAQRIIDEHVKNKELVHDHLFYYEGVED